jgi:KDO2-lipid IV(A) lauroyltransferase
MIVFHYLLYYLVIIPLSLLPFPLLYGFSNLIYVFLYYIRPYRKKIVLENLRNSFPEKTEEEIQIICKKFYRHFADIIVESLKVFTVSKDTLLKRMKCVNPELVESYYKKGRSVILVTGHYANWEWAAITVGTHSSHYPLGIYQVIKNKFWDRKMQSTRSRFGTNLMSTREVANYFERFKDALCLYGFIADQTPSNPDKCHWMQFLGQDTPVMFGTEKYARQYNYPVLYGKITRIKRGYYQIEYFPICDEPSQTKVGEITEWHTRFNEGIIKAAPEYWLWTHRRWKHKRK